MPPRKMFCRWTLTDAKACGLKDTDRRMPDTTRPIGYDRVAELDLAIRGWPSASIVNSLFSFSSSLKRWAFLDLHRSIAPIMRVSVSKTPGASEGPNQGWMIVAICEA